MLISIVSPHATNNGNTVSSLLLGMGLADTKRKILLTHTNPQSPAFERYLGLQAFEDKTSTPTQLVKLMREGAIKAEEIGDYCKEINDYLHVFTNNESNFSEHDMATLLNFLITSDLSMYEHIVFDVDASRDHEASQTVVSKSDIIILNITASFLELDKFNAEKERIIKMCRGKKVIMLCSQYDSKASKVKDITKFLGLNTTVHVIRENSWVKWACNQGKLYHVFKQGKIKDSDVIEVFKDTTSLAGAVAKAKVSIGKAQKGVFKNVN